VDLLRGSGAGLGGSRFHARMDNRFDDRPISQCEGYGAGLGGSCFHDRIDDHFNDRPSSQRGRYCAGVGGSRLHATTVHQCYHSTRIDDHFDNHPSLYSGGRSAASHEVSSCHSRFDNDNRFDDRPRIVNRFDDRLRIGNHFDDGRSYEGAGSSAGLDSLRPNAANNYRVDGDGFFSRSSVLNSSLQNYHDGDHFTQPRCYDYHNNQEAGHGCEHHPSFLPLASCSDVHKHASGGGLPRGQSFLPGSTVSTVKERDYFCSEVLGVRSRYHHLLDKSIFNLGFVYADSDNNFSSANSTSSLTNLRILSQERWRSGILLFHFIFPAERQASNTRMAEGPHYQAPFLDFILAMKQYRGPDIRFVFYDPTVNHSTAFLFILYGESASKYTSAIAWPKIKKRIGLDCPSFSLPTSNTVRQAAGNYADYGFCSSQNSNQKESTTGHAMPALKENSKTPEIVDAFVALTLFGSKTRNLLWRLHKENFSQIATDVLSQFPGKINNKNKVTSLHTAITSIHQPCVCHNDGATNSKIHPYVLCASIIDGDNRISCNAQQRKSIDDYKLRCDDFEEALTAIKHVYRNLEPNRRSVTTAICDFLRREDELMTELMNHKRSTSY
jgi:hypothetical protein